MPPIGKAFAYITCDRDRQREILLFAHRDEPEAGIQIPKGTIEPDEAPAEAALREAHEETGLENLMLVGPIASDLWTFMGVTYASHFFHFTVEDAPDEFEHTVFGAGEDNGMVFLYFWSRDGHELPSQYGHGDYLDRVLK